MAAPTMPTSATIIAEGANKVFRGSIPSDITTRGTLWLEEIKNDIWTQAKKLKSLQTTNKFVLTEGEGFISNPTDFSSDLSLSLLEGQHYGVCQAGGSTTTAKLAADEDMAATYPIGKEIVVYLTATKTTAFSGFITAFNTTTKVATFSPAISVSPDATYSYVVIESAKPIEQRQVIRLDEVYKYADRGTPESFYPVGDDSDGSYYLYPIPYWGDSIPRVIAQRYYADLMEVDLSGTLIGTLYKRWRNMWIQGIFAKTLETTEDPRTDREMAKYKASVREVTARETYGSDLSNMSASVSD